MKAAVHFRGQIPEVEIFCWWILVSCELMENKLSKIQSRRRPLRFCTGPAQHHQTSPRCDCNWQQTNQRTKELQERERERESIWHACDQEQLVCFLFETLKAEICVLRSGQAFRNFRLKTYHICTLEELWATVQSL